MLLNSRFPSYSPSFSTTDHVLPKRIYMLEVTQLRYTSDHILQYFKSEISTLLLLILQWLFFMPYFQFLQFYIISISLTILVLLLPDTEHRMKDRKDKVPILKTTLLNLPMEGLQQLQNNFVPEMTQDLTDCNRFFWSIT